MGAQIPAAMSIAGALSLGLLTYGISLVFFILALRHLGTARTEPITERHPLSGLYLPLACWLSDGAFAGIVTWRFVDGHVQIPLIG